MNKNIIAAIVSGLFLISLLGCENTTSSGGKTQTSSGWIEVTGITQDEALRIEDINTNITLFQGAENQPDKVWLALGNGDGSGSNSIAVGFNIYRDIEKPGVLNLTGSHILEDYRESHDEANQFAVSYNSTDYLSVSGDIDVTYQSGEIIGTFTAKLLPIEDSTSTEELNISGNINATSVSLFCYALQDTTDGELQGGIVAEDDSSVGVSVPLSHEFCRKYFK
jgi:hypothetical protein